MDSAKANSSTGGGKAVQECLFAFVIGAFLGSIIRTRKLDRFFFFHIDA